MPCVIFDELCSYKANFFFTLIIDTKSFQIVFIYFLTKLRENAFTGKKRSYFFAIGHARIYLSPSRSEVMQ